MGNERLFWKQTSFLTELT